MERLSRFSWFYAFMQVPVAITLHCFYRRLIVRKHNSIPKGVPVIYCSNHQNAFLDALLIAIVTNTQPASLVRADVFNNPIAKKFLNGLKMMPVFRMRDGFNTLAQNDSIFQTVRNLLVDKGSIIIFPEGNHGERKQLRPLKKGVGRIAMSTLAENPNMDDILVLPIGLEYSNHQNFRSSVVVEIGKPIEVKNFIAAYKENEAIGLRSFNEKLKPAISKLMLDIKQKAKYEVVHDFIDSNILSTSISSDDINARLDLARKLLLELDSWEDDDLTANKLKDWWGKHPDHIENSNKGANPIVKVLSGICVIPFILVYWIASQVGERLTKDPQFVSSLKAVAGMLLFPVLFAFYTWVISMFLPVVLLPVGIAAMLLIFWGSLQYFND